MDRFGKLENEAALPPSVSEALSHLSRFNALEIGASPAAKPPAQPAPKVAPVQPPTPTVACVHCGQPNEPQRETCWACYRFVKVKAAGPGYAKAQDQITIVLDGLTYSSNDKDLPDDVRELMRRISKKGFSQELLAEWRQWRAVRNVPQRQAGPSGGADEPKVFRGQRVSVIRLDGKIYTSDDPNLSEDLKRLFEYIDTHGVTPALMERLRAMGSVKVRPTVNALPSDGDVEFWKQVREASPQAERLTPDRYLAEIELTQARERYDEAWRRGLGAAVGIGFAVLYIVLRLFLN